MAIKFKENLKTIRKAYNLSQIEMSERLSIPVKRYQSYEEGRASPRLEDILTFCYTTNFNLDQLIITNIEADFTPMQINQLALKKSKH
ncbi:helix-turn-helix transcriptional regulator [Ferruginibacter sp.]|uniref:helix-turn-helix transcriptional regulator n=1 Tax=Ferruginibacter sp. TaxID=1940288 RepID=UPI00374CD266